MNYVSNHPRGLRSIHLVAALALTASVATAHDDVLFPDGGEVFQPGEVVTLQWTVSIEHHPLVDWDVWYSATGNQGPWAIIALGIPPGDAAAGALHTLDWTVPNAPTTEASIRVRMNSSSSFWDDTSAADFTIAAPLGSQECMGQAVNSTGVSASLFLVGSDSANDNDLDLSVMNLPPNVSGFALNSDTVGFSPNAGGADGNLCLGGSIGRHITQITSSSAAGHAAISLDLTNVPRGASNDAVVAGQTFRFQWWYRDTNPAATSNFSDSRSVTFQ